uniref:Cation/H+ exchanger transmembrane domain-containing protein n=1 Tax=Hucho hucho TaxID=62062 RepID=A0A4W5JPS6_9TELE
FFFSFFFIKTSLSSEQQNKTSFLVPLAVRGSMLLTGFLLRNIPVVTDAVYIDFRWSASLRNIALAVILARAGLGLDELPPCRVSLQPCSWRATSYRPVGFVLGAVSPAVVVPSMLLLQKDGYGLEQGVPTLLMAAGSLDDILAITGFTTCMGMAFATGRDPISREHVGGGMVAGVLLGFLLRYFPSKDQDNVVMKRSFLLLGLSVFAVFGSNVAGFPGSGGLCTLVLAFLAGLGWRRSKVPVEDIVGIAWEVFQPLLFGLIGAEIQISELNKNTVGENTNTRINTHYIYIYTPLFGDNQFVFQMFSYFNLNKAAIGSTALDMARTKEDKELEKYGMDVLTVAVLSILLTAPIGALIIGLTGPRLLQKPKNPQLQLQVSWDMSL